MISRFARDSIIYMISNVLSKGMAVLLLPLYTRLLSQSELGVVDYITVLMLLLNVVLLLELPQGLARYLPEGDHEEQRRYISSAFWFAVLTYSAAAALIFSFPEPFAALLLGDRGQATVMRAAAGTIWASGIFFQTSQSLRWHLRPLAFAITTLAGAVVTISTTLALLWQGYGVIGALLGQMAGFLVGAAIAIAADRPFYQLRLALNPLRNMLSFAIPLVPASAGAFATLYMDRVLVGQLLSLAALGTFSVAYRISSMVYLSTTGFHGALMPLIYASYSEPSTPATLARIFRYFCAVALTLILGLSLFAPELVRLLTTPEFYEAMHLIPLLIPAMVLSAATIFAPGPLIEKRTGMIALINLGGGVLNLLLNLLLIPRLGLYGAGTATLTSNTVTLLLLLWLSQHSYPVPYPWRAVLLATLGTTALIVGAQWHYAIDLPSLLLRAALALCGPLVLIGSGLIKPQDLGALLRRLRQRLPAA